VRNYPDTIAETSTKRLRIALEEMAMACGVYHSSWKDEHIPPLVGEITRIVRELRLRAKEKKK
jgi:hypothetical protein